MLGQKNVVSLSPTFDFDRDGLSEFLALEKQNFNDNFPSSAVFYEIDDFGSHIELWRYTTLDQIIKAEIGDINGNALPDIVLLSRSSFLGLGSDEPFWLKAFPWTEIDFSPEPMFTFKALNDSLRVRPSSFSLLDLDFKEKQDEVIFAQSSPIRSISINTISKNETFDIITSLIAQNISIGYAPIYITKFDYNGNSSQDIIALTPEEKIMKLHIFLNNSEGLSKGISASVPYPFDKRNPIGLIPSGLINADIDSDGLDELILPFSSGIVLALKQQGSKFFLTNVDSEKTSLFQFSNPLTESDINNILLTRAELGIGSNNLQNLALSKTPVTESKSVINEPTDLKQTNDQNNIATMRLSAVPVIGSSQNDSSNIVNGISGQLKPVSISSVNKELSTSSTTGSTLLGRSGKMKQISLSNLGNNPKKNMITSDTAFVGQQFNYPVVPSKGTLAQFRKVSLPEGAFYNSTTKNIIWTPSKDQVGLQNFEFQIMIQGGGSRPIVDEVRGQGVSVRSTTQVELVTFKVVVIE
ncbi:MAG: hypothetical protein CMG75_02665 [Candidatus Marinimicrobia bacterium]|nr:hypothetical protein [Candidatus Neomarinimicrobiota bacterium]